MSAPTVDEFAGFANVCLDAGDGDALVEVLRIMSVYHPGEAYRMRAQIIDAALVALGGAS